MAPGTGIGLHIPAVRRTKVTPPIADVDVLVDCELFGGNHPVCWIICSMLCINVGKVVVEA